MATVKQWIRRSGSALLGVGLALSGFGLVGGTLAQAAPPPGPTNHWCPGDPWNPDWGMAYDWNWSRCHDWQGPATQIGTAGSGPWGPAPVWAPPQPAPPPWAPGAQLMYNPTTGVWGFWNNGIWSPI
jgi:hypothetical protein